MHIEEIEEMEVTEMKKIIISKKTICNKCGAEFNHESDGGMQSIELYFDYRSNFEEESWVFDICDDCLISLVKTFKYVPEGFFGSYDMSTEKRQKVFDRWKETGEWDRYAFDTYEQLLAAGRYWKLESINGLIKKHHPNKPLLKAGDQDI